MSSNPFTRRRALAACGCVFAASPLLRAQQLAGEPPGRITPLSEAVNAFEFEFVAQRKLDSATYAEIAGSDRRYIDRITFNPRLAVNTSNLDLTTTLFVESHFAPILVGPTSEQKRFHPEGELAMARGASAAKTAIVVASRSSYPIDQIAAQAKTPLWYQVYPESDASAVRSRVEHHALPAIDGRSRPEGRRASWSQDQGACPARTSTKVGPGDRRRPPTPQGRRPQHRARRRHRSSC